MELDEFFAARLDEEEAAAKAAAAYGGAERWRIDIENCIRPNPAADNGYIACGPWGGGLLDQHAAHIVRYDPASALRDVEADRELLVKYQIAKALQPGKYKLGYCEAMEEIIAIRAARFRDHPDYRVEWAPPTITGELRSAITKARHSPR